MKKGPFKNYGFTYEYEGSSFVFHIVASSEEEAIGRAQAMSGATFDGELKPSLSEEQDCQVLTAQEAAHPAQEGILATYQAVQEARIELR